MPPPSVLLTSYFFSSREDYWQPEGTSVLLIVRFLTTDITDEHGLFADFFQKCRPCKP